MNSYLADEIELANLHAQYDEHVKRLLKDKNVLAHILICSVKEFSGYSLEEAVQCIEEEPEVASHPVRPNRNSEKIFGSSMESSIPGEGQITYDIVFTAYTKDDEKVKLYINVEAQKSFYPGYDLVTRGVFYGARLLSEQLDKEFTPADYDGIKKVYSIWICMNTPEKDNVADSITEFSLQPNSIYGNYSRNSRYDLLSVIMVCLTEKTINSKNSLIGMLSSLLSYRLSAEEKKKTLENDYNIPMTVEMEKEVNVMCNLSYGISEMVAAEAAEAAQKAVAEATEKATLNTLFSLVEKKLLKASDAAKEAKMSESDFIELMNKKS